jgi:hypothetical protein
MLPRIAANHRYRRGRGARYSAVTGHNRWLFRGLPLRALPGSESSILHASPAVSVAFARLFDKDDKDDKNRAFAIQIYLRMCPNRGVRIRASLIKITIQ